MSGFEKRRPIPNALAAGALAAGMMSADPASARLHLGNESVEPSNHLSAERLVSRMRDVGQRRFYTNLFILRKTLAHMHRDAGVLARDSGIPNLSGPMRIRYLKSALSRAESLQQKGVKLLARIEKQPDLTKREALILRLQNIAETQRVYVLYVLGYYKRSPSEGVDRIITRFVHKMEPLIRDPDESAPRGSPPEAR